MKDSTGRLSILARLALAIAGIVAVSASTALAAPYLVFRPSPGNCYQLYQPSTGARFVLLGTEKMANVVVGDVDGDGLENDLVYSNSVSGGMGYYTIPSDGKWHPENDHPVPGIPTDSVPLAVLRLNASGYPGILVFNSASTSYTCASMPDGSGYTPIGHMDKAFAVDARLQGFKGDLAWWTSGVGMSWRESATGPDHQAPWDNLIPLGGAKIVPGQQEKSIVFFPYGADVVYVCDQYWNYTRIDGATWPWSTNAGSIAFGDITSDGVDEAFYVSSATDPLRCYKVPTNGAPYDPNGVSADNTMKPGWNLHGVANATLGSVPVYGQSQIANLRKLADGTSVLLSAKPRTKLVREKDQGLGTVTTGYYIQEPARNAGIRVMGTTAAAEGQLVSVRGTIHTLNGEKVLIATGETVSSQASVISPVATTIKSMYSALSMAGLLVRVAGTIVAATPAAGTLTISDGSKQSLRIYCPDATVTSGQVTVTGCVGAEMNASGKVVPVLRVEKASGGISGDGGDGDGGTNPPPVTTVNYFVWTDSSLNKVPQNEAAKALQPVSIRAAKNEHEPFQIVLRGDTQTLKSVTITPRDLRSATGTIAASNIKAYLPYYIYLPRYSKHAPDPLPEHKAPFDLQPGQVQPVWLDVYVPKTTPAGDYSGTVGVSAANGKTVDVPVTLRVYNFTLPDESKIVTQFDFNDYYMAPKEGVAYGSAECRTLWKKYYEFLLDKGISTSALPVDDFMSAEAAAYLRDPRLTSFRIPEHTNPTTQRNYFNQIKNNGAWHKGFCILPDEVYDKTTYDKFKAQASYYKSIDPTAPCLATYYTATPTWAAPQHTTDLLAGYANIWCPITGEAFEDDRLAVRRAAGERVWTYICTNPDGMTPNFFLQDPAMSHRIITWQCYAHQATGWLYWHSNYWNDVTDPWTDACTGKLIDGRLYGEGSLLYPGKTHTGVAGPVSSIRLEVFRDSLDDYKYLWLLEQKIGRAGVMNYVQQLISTWQIYNKDIAKFESIRDQIAQRIAN